MERLGVQWQVNKVNKPEDLISESEKTALVEAILARQESKKEKKKALSKDLRKTIQKAANSNDEEFVKLGAMLAFEAIETFYSKKATAFAEYGRTEVEDLQSELYLLVLKHLHQYNGENSLFTFFDPLVTRAFAKTREKGRGLTSSRYFRELGPYISKAIDEIRVMGLLNPTPTDISDYIRVKRGKVIAESTIEQWIAVHKEHASLEEISDLYNYEAEEALNPETSLIKQEETQEFYEAVMKTTPRSRAILLMEVEYIDQHGLMPTTKDLFPKLLKESIVRNFEDAEISIAHAHQELKSVITGKRRRLKRLPINRIKDSIMKDEILEEENEDIEKALNDSISDFFEDM